MRKTYGPGYPRTLGALMAWSGLDPEVPAVTDAAGTPARLPKPRAALGRRAALWGCGFGLSGGAVAAERERLSGRNLCLRSAWCACHIPAFGRRKWATCCVGRAQSLW